MLLIIAAALIAGAVVWGCGQVAAELKATRDEGARGRALEILAAFAPGVSAAAGDPRAILQWEPLARSARQIFPDRFAELDRAAGGRFPFTAERIQAAHAQWTADWLAWEGAHDAAYKLKAAVVEEELGRDGAALAARARFEAVEREKLELYQRRYQEYIQVAKALQQIMS